MEKLVYDYVRHAYGAVTALEDFRLEVAEGEIMCLLGPSGCGKTTALRLAAGLERLQTGSIQIAGRCVATPERALPPEARDVGLLFQDYALFPHLSVAENVAFGLRRRMTSAARAERVREALRQTGLGGYAERYPHELSGGQQQRVALARCLAPEPSVVLLDEPFSGLDGRLRDQVRDETLHLLKRTQATALMVTHDAEEAMFMADRIALMEAGRLRQVGTPVELYCHPKDPFVAEFFGEVNRFVGKAENGRVVFPFGDLPARGLADGARAQVIVRPEALRLSPPHEGTDPRRTATVLAARMLGRTSLVHLCLCRQTGEEVHLHSRMPGRFLPPRNSVMAVELDRSQAFVFPAAGPT